MQLCENSITFFFKPTYEYKRFTGTEHTELHVVFTKTIHRRIAAAFFCDMIIVLTKTPLLMNTTSIKCISPTKKKKNRKQS